jgi:hypothetical protein
MFFETLDAVPEGSVLHSVTAAPGSVGGRAALRVELTDEITAHGTPGVHYVDMPTFVLLPIEFRTGVIEVDVLARLNGKTDFDARGFAGVAFDVDAGLTSFQSVYLRVLNGRKAHPAPPRDRRAVQYFAYPDWPFSRLRDEYPDGRFEAGAEIGPDEWNTLAVTVEERSVGVAINGVHVLAVPEPKLAIRGGRIGLFVDIGTEAYFRDLRVRPDA